MKKNLLTIGALIIGIIVPLSFVDSQSSSPTGTPNPDSQIKETKPEPASSKTTAKQDSRQQSSKVTKAKKTTNLQVANAASADQPTEFAREPEQSGQTVVIDNKTYPLRTYKALALPNDPSANQWWVSSTKLSSAWNIAQGANQTTLAVIDTGFALKHQEFTNRWASNTGETGVASTENPSRLNCTDQSKALDASCNLIDDNFDGIIDNELGAVSYENPSRLNCTDQSKALTKDCNQIDDDSNGHIDDVTGWDFINNDNSVQAGENNPSGTGTTHGTLVAGVAAATGNNGVGIAGVDWQTKILPIQALDDDSYGDTLSVGRGIYYAISRGVDVISISLGSAAQDSYVRDAVRSALANGITVVAASGNDGCNCMSYPANYPETIAVGALDQSNQRATFSSYGANLDILAPGVNITSPTWIAGNQISSYSSGVAGTSFSTPMVAGMLTRLISQRPELTPQQQFAALSEKSDRLTLSSTQSRSDTVGFGSVNILSATQRVTQAYAPGITYAFGSISKGEFLLPSPVEAGGSYHATACGGSAFGTTKIYELTKAGKTFFTISHSEAGQAVTNGYASSNFAYVCLQQPQDTPTTLRLLNTFGEFKNSFAKE